MAAACAARITVCVLACDARRMHAVNMLLSCSVDMFAAADGAALLMKLMMRDAIRVPKASSFPRADKTSALSRGSSISYVACDFRVSADTMRCTGLGAALFAPKEVDSTVASSRVLLPGTEHGT